ncbi:unnamed protein product, partial [Ectocarpus sp. 12 AP-2014]
MGSTTNARRYKNLSGERTDKTTRYTKMTKVSSYRACFPQRGDDLFVLKHTAKLRCIRHHFHPDLIFQSVECSVSVRIKSNQPLPARSSAILCVMGPMYMVLNPSTTSSPPLSSDPLRLLTNRSPPTPDDGIDPGPSSPLDSLRYPNGLFS